MSWTDATIKRLRADWAAGVSTAEIGRRLHMSKNAVVRKARALGLASRPSPIRPAGAAKPGRVKPLAAGAATLPALPSLRSDG